LFDTENNGVGGRLPSELEQLRELQFLLLEIGAIAGTIPTELGTLQNLVSIGSIVGLVCELALHSFLIRYPHIFGA
jgi:hypothetical protein